ncbi:MAG: hypothetical protein ACI8WB_006094, partial [Phenylobacterium sp.]
TRTLCLFVVELFCGQVCRRLLIKFDYSIEVSV